jgi:hypothetical protein
MGVDVASTCTMVVQNDRSTCGRHNLCIKTLIDEKYAPLERSWNVEHYQGCGDDFWTLKSKNTMFNGSNWLQKVSDPNFPNSNLPLKWPCKLIPLIFFTLKTLR